MEPQYGLLTAPKPGNAGGQSRYLHSPLPDYTAKPQNNSWISMLPSGLAAAASFIPGVGMVIGGGLGAIGEAARQNMAGEDTDLGKIAGEAALSAIPFGLGRAAKLAKAGATAAKGYNVTLKGIKAADVASDAMPFSGAASAVKSGIEAARTTNITRSGLQAADTAADAGTFIGKATKSGGKGAEWVGQSRGLTAGAKVPGQEALSAERAAQLNSHLDNIPGMPTSSAKNQLVHAEQYQRSVGKAIGDTVDKANRAVPNSELTVVKNRINQQIDNLVGLPKETPETLIFDANGKPLVSSAAAANHPKIAEYMADLSRDGGTLKGLKNLSNKIADDVKWNRSSATPDPNLEKIAKAFRTGIEEHIGEAVPELKPLQKFYHDNADALDYLKVAANSAQPTKGGVQVPFFGKMGGGAVQATKAKVGAALNGVGGDVAPEAAASGGSFMSKAFNGAKTVAGNAAGQVGVRAAADAIIPGYDPTGEQANTQSAAVADPFLLNQAQDPSLAAGASGATATAADATGNTAFDFDAKAREILNSGADAKTQSAQLDLLAKYQAIYEKSQPGGKSGNKLNSTASGVVTDSRSAIDELYKLKESINGGLGSTGPIMGRLRTLNPYDTGEQSLQAQIDKTKQIVGKALEGGVLRKEDEEKYKKILPTTADTKAVAQAKIDYLTAQLEERLQNYVSLVGGNTDSQDLLNTLQ